MVRRILLSAFIFFSLNSTAQTRWQQIDTLFGDLPLQFHVYRSSDSVDGAPNKMYYVSVPAKSFAFTSDTSKGRRLTPHQYYEKNNQPLLVVNAGFFSFATNENLNVVVKDGKIVGKNAQLIKGKGVDSGSYIIPFYGAFGIKKNGKPDVAWTFTDPESEKVFASQEVVPSLKRAELPKKKKQLLRGKGFRKWKVQTAVGGGPVLVQNGEVQITNNEERKFAGKAVDDRHPRTAIGYTHSGDVIVFVCEGRSEKAAGLTLTQMAGIMRNLGCEEALNLDGGGSTLLLVNGREVNNPSSEGVQRPVPSVFIVK